MDSSDFRICHLQFRYSLFAAVALTGGAQIRISRPARLIFHYIPSLATPRDLMIRFRCLESSTTAFPLCPLGQHLHFKLTRLHIGSLALRSAVLPRGNLQPLITQTLLPWTKEVYEQFLLRDFNPIRLIADNGIRTQNLIEVGNIRFSVILFYNTV